MPPRPHNFNAGPAVLPLPVLRKVRDQLLDTRGTGLSLLEWSHRSPWYADVHAETEAALRRLLELGEDGPYRLIMLQGGASLQFAQVPMNLAPEGVTGDYVVTGAWSRKALAEARRLGRGREAWSGEAEGFRRVPRDEELDLLPEAPFVHVTTNNTIHGTRWAGPRQTEAPLVADMSSDILAGPLDVERFGLIYAGAQKNLGPAGLALVILREDLLERAPEDLPAILSYAVHAEAGGLYHTPNTFAVWVMGLVLQWIEEQGGLASVGRANREKADLVYQVIDEGDFYRGTAEPDSRSTMNVTFRLPSGELEARFLEEAQAAGFLGLKGHRSVGGLRASLYNALPRESAAALVDFMRDFARRRG